MVLFGYSVVQDKSPCPELCVLAMKLIRAVMTQDQAFLLYTPEYTTYSYCIVSISLD